MNSNDEELRFLYLLSGSCNVLPSSYVKLRSYLNIHLSNLLDQQNLQLFKSFRNRNKTCPYCYSSWSADTTTFKLLPSKSSKRNKFRNVISEDGKTEKSTVNESRNTLVLRCKVCCKKSPFSLVKKKFLDEKLKEENVECIKKKKKKKDKSCGLAVNLIKPENYISETAFSIKVKKRFEEGTNKIIGTNPAYQDTESRVPQKNTPVSKTPICGTSKSLVPNPFAPQIQQGFLGKRKQKKLERLKQAVKEEKNLTKKTLKDFLTLV